jgi:signal transduction histidine kinase
MKIDQIQARLPDVAEYEDEFDSAKEFINKAIQDIRSLTFQLRPPILANAGLDAALRWLAQDFGQQHGISVSVQHVESPIQLEYGIRVTLYQAVRELLLNVVKHAKARNVLITVNSDPGELILTVMDDGVGFAMPKDFAMHSNSFGLFNTLQRIKYHGGQMLIESSPGGGTRVIITIPHETGATA